MHVSLAVDAFFVGHTGRLLAAAGIMVVVGRNGMRLAAAADVAVVGR